MAVTGWGPILLFIPEGPTFDQCRLFYEHGLGLTPQTVRPGYVEYPVGSGSLALHATAAPRTGTGPVALHLMVSDVDAIAAQLNAAGFQHDAAVVTQPWGRELAVTDPAGFSFDVLEPPGQESGN
jgi:predicted enzyme related to lactoylglutathione lyase